MSVLKIVRFISYFPFCSIDFFTELNSNDKILKTTDVTAITVLKIVVTMIMMILILLLLILLLRMMMLMKI